jgi:3-dehydroquinate dehydratase
MKIIIFSCSNVSKDLLNILSDDVDLIGFCDNNLSLHNKQFKEQLVYAPSDINEIDFDYIIVASVHYKAILKQLTEIIRIPREKILVFIGSCRTPKSLGNDNDIKLKKLLKKASSNKIGFSLLEEDEENSVLKEFYKKVPNYVLENYDIEYFNHKEQTDCAITIHKNLNGISNYLISTNIAIWNGLSSREISQIRDIPDDYIREGAYIHGISYIMLKGDYENKLPCISWDINNNKLTVLGIPYKNIKSTQTNCKGNESNKLIYIPSPLYKLNSEMPVMDCFYVEPYIREILNKTEELKSKGLDIIIALPEKELLSLKFEETENIKLIAVESDGFYSTLASADIVVTDNSITALEYMMFGNAVVQLDLDIPDYEPQKEYTLKGYDKFSLVHYVKTVEEMLNLSYKLLEFGDDCANARRGMKENLCFDSNDELPKRLWDEIVNYLKSSIQEVN